jgi:hypothetical protein
MGALDEINREMGHRYISCARINHFWLPDLLSVSSLLRRHDLRTEYGQRCCLVGNLASLLGDPMEFAEVARTSTRISY